MGCDRSLVIHIIIVLQETFLPPVDFPLVAAHDTRGKSEVVKILRHHKAPSCEALFINY